MKTIPHRNQPQTPDLSLEKYCEQMRQREHTTWRGTRLDHLVLCCHLASYPESVNKLPADVRKALRARLTESIKDYGYLQQVDHPLNRALSGMFSAESVAFFQQAQGDLGDPELEELRQALREVFEQIRDNHKLVVVPTSHSAFPSSAPHTAFVFDRRMRRKIYVSSEWFSLVMHNTVQLLDEFGLDSVRLCPQCGMYFIAIRRQKFCSRKCNEATKRSRPERQEYQALLMFKRNYSKSHKGQTPTKRVVAAWRETYQKKRRKRQSARTG